jgi:membrane fusion protein (multidrug efflux system)
MARTIEPEEGIDMSSPMRIEREAAPAAVSEPAPETPPKPKRRGGRRAVILGVLAVLVIVGAVMGYRTVVFYQHHATTDDAQIDGNINPVLPRVSGYVQEVRVAENQHVNAGDVLVVIDPSDLQAKVDQEEAALLNAEAAVSVAQAAVAGARATVTGGQANVAAARTREQQAAADLERYKALWKKEEISQQEYDAARSTTDAARAAADAARATVSSSAAQVEAATRRIAAAQAEVAQHRATLHAARLQLSYATLKAPVSGLVSKKSVEVGQLVQMGQPLLSIVQGHDAWVTANFKETQLAQMRPGQPVDIEVDAYPGVKFHGKVESLAAATGARFSLLPPDNATGNFTKVVQRVPVKIAFTDRPDPRHPMRVGMNVNVVVDLG